jgi:predicted  nucleic acid-binding Zn-ribbon protein
VVALAQVLTDKTASAEVTTKSVAQLETQMAGIEKTIVEMTGKLASLSTELAALQKQQTDSTTACKDLETKLVASSASVAKARVAIEEASKAVEQQMNELALAKATAAKQPSGS